MHIRLWCAREPMAEGMSLIRIQPTRPYHLDEVSSATSQVIANNATGMSTQLASPGQLDKRRAAPLPDWLRLRPTAARKLHCTTAGQDRPLQFYGARTGTMCPAPLRVVDHQALSIDAGDQYRSCRVPEPARQSEAPQL